jgi:hypothetical protein
MLLFLFLLCCIPSLGRKAYYIISQKLILANMLTQVPHMQIAMVWDLHLHSRSLGADFVV